jgi:opacity protein-like surface antigen
MDGKTAKRTLCILAISIIVFNIPVLAWAKGLFYVAPKAIAGQMKAEFEPSSIEIRVWPRALSELVYGPQIVFSHGMVTNKTQTFGILALGVNLYDSLGLPLRLEFEMSNQADAKARGEDVTFYYPNGSAIYIKDDYLAYSVQTATMNIYADWRNDTAFVPYLGGGVGIGRISARAEVSQNAYAVQRYGPGMTPGLTTVLFQNRASEFIWHLDTGISLNLTDKVALDLGYRYLYFDKSLKLGADPIYKERRSDSPTVDAPHNPYWADTVSTFPYGWPVRPPYYEGRYLENVGYDEVFSGPKAIKFSATHQVAMSVRYSF